MYYLSEQIHFHYTATFNATLHVLGFLAARNEFSINNER